MNLKNLHKLQLKTAIYQLFSHPGVLSDEDIIDVLVEVKYELGGDNA